MLIYPHLQVFIQSDAYLLSFTYVHPIGKLLQHLFHLQKKAHVTINIMSTVAIKAALSFMMRERIAALSYMMLEGFFFFFLK